MVIEIGYSDSVQHPCIFKDKNLQVFIEDSPIGWMVHCYIKNWTINCYKRLLDLLVITLNKAPNKELYCVSNNKKLTKFSEMFGFEDIDTIHDSKGNEIGVLMKCVIL